MRAFLRLRIAGFHARFKAIKRLSRIAVMANEHEPHERGH